MGATCVVYEEKNADPGAGNPTPLLALVSTQPLSRSEALEWELSYCVQGCYEDWGVIPVKHLFPAALPFSQLSTPPSERASKIQVPGKLHTCH